MIPTPQALIHPDEYSSSLEDYHSGGNGWLNDDSSSSDDNDNDFRRVQPFNHHGKVSSSSSDDVNTASFVESSCYPEGQSCGWPLRGECCAGLRCRIGLWGVGTCVRD